MITYSGYALAMFWAHALPEWAWPHTHVNVMTFTKLAPTAM